MDNSIWSNIIEHYKKEKGSDLDGWELYKISEYFAPIKICINQYEVDERRRQLELGWKEIKSGAAPKLSWFQIKPIIQKSIKDVYYQALLDFKENKCSLETVNYIEKFI